MSHLFELHLTVQCNPHAYVSPNSISFEQACAKLGVKPLVVDLGSAGHDVMTSSKYEGNFSAALIHAGELAQRFRQFDMTVIRIKIETVPWHPVASTPNENQYFESHLAVQICGAEQEKALRSFSLEHGCHTSRNAFKVYPNYKVIMVTKRDANTTAPDFIARVDAIRKALTDSDFKVDKPIIEFVIYDSNQAHDDKWIADLELSHDH